MKVGEEPPPLFEPAYNGPGGGKDAPRGEGPPRVGSPRGKTTRPGPGSRRQPARRFQVLNSFRDVGARAAGLRPSERLVWLVLWSHVDARSGLARISYRALADKTGLGDRQVSRVVQELIARGFVEVDSRGGPKKWTVNAYRLHPIPDRGRLHADLNA
jgi:hypothetical protein